MSIKKIVITGGPCSGKTTGMNYLSEKLRDIGYVVFIVPEMATELISSGFNPVGADNKDIVKFEKLLVKSQIWHEEIILELASSASRRGNNVVVLMDRGVMDVSAYVDKNEFQAILDNLQKTVVNLRDKRYDAVLHLVTAADGAADFYTLENNTARLESDPKDAIMADIKTKKAWVGHPHLRVIDNSTDFEGKIRRVFQEVCNILGVPEPIERERKFLVSSFKLPKNIELQKIDIEQVYLRPRVNGYQERVRRRGQNGSFVYYKTCKMPTGEVGVRIETEEQITGYDYVDAIKKFADPLRQRINKQRSCFLWNNTYYELDVISQPRAKQKLILLEVESTDYDKDLLIPDFIKIDREVTDDKKFENYSIAEI
jgi:CYTH domain-containing protein/nucleoside-triphosphatase THEP1